MNIIEIPQTSNGNYNFIVNYSVNGEVLSIRCRTHEVATDVILNDTEDVFDFTGLPDGELMLDTMETFLHFSPLRKVSKENGVVTVELVTWT